MIEREIFEGASFTQSFVINQEQTARYLGSGNLEVFATPAMIACMENTALKLLEKSLPKGSDSVGTEIIVKHFKASIPGEEIVFEARVVKIENKKVIFEITANNKENICIGKADHTRYIINVEEFMGKLKKGN